MDQTERPLPPEFWSSPTVAVATGYVREFDDQLLSALL
jgi:hypothetical protein